MRIQRNRMSITIAILGVASTLAWARPSLAVDILDDPIQIDDRAVQLVQSSNSLCWEMYRYHQQQVDYTESYQLAKDVWTKAGLLREALRAGPVETEALLQQATEMSDAFAQLERSLSKWGPGDLSLVAANSGPTQRTVVEQGVAVDLPLIGLRVGGPQVLVDEDGPPQLQRRRLHHNSPGSKRSLEREIAAVKVAMAYLLEDAGIAGPETSTGTGAVSAPTPAAPTPDSGLTVPQRATPSSTKKPEAVPTRK
jgi:hypothetical protein